MARVPVPRRGEIWLIDFDPSIGAEIQKSDRRSSSARTRSGVCRCELSSQLRIGNRPTYTFLGLLNCPRRRSTDSLRIPAQTPFKPNPLRKADLFTFSVGFPRGNWTTLLPLSPYASVRRKFRFNRASKLR